MDSPSTAIRFVINFHKILGKDVFAKGILFFFIYIFLVSSSIMIIFVTQVNLFYLNFKFVLLRQTEETS